MPLLSFIPRERQFFALFRENAGNLLEALKILNNLLHSSSTSALSPHSGASAANSLEATAPSPFAEQAKLLRDLEHRGDEITHRVNRELNQTFITPFDREDIYALAGQLDDVIDLVDEIADTIIIDGISEITPEAQQMGDILLEIGHELVQAFDKLESRKDMTQHWVKIHDLENQGDRITRAAIGALFRNNQDPIHIIKWKDVYALLEKTVDRTEDVANILESVTIKNA